MGTRKDALLAIYEDILDEAKICLAIKMPDGSTELIINQNAKAKIEYIDKAYDENLQLRSNPTIEILNYMIYA